MPFTATRPQIYFRAGGIGEPLLCIPAFAVSSSPFEAVRPLYETRFRFVTYDHAGAGRSAKYPMPLSMAQLAAGVVRVMDELEIDSAHVLGSSLGGLVAQELALRFPHRVRGMVLLGTASAGPLATPPPIGGLLRATGRIVAGSLSRRRLWLAPALFASEFPVREPDRAKEVNRRLTQGVAPPSTIFGQLLAFSTHDRDRDLGRIRAPTLVVHGELDALVSVANAHRLAGGIPDAEIHIVRGAGHGCLIEEQQAVFETICDWLDRRSPIATPPAPRGLAALVEPLTRKAAVPIGAVRVQRNSLALAWRALNEL
jgi:pimeloyl-ACP methyl ester carboxylesterase